MCEKSNGPVNAETRRPVHEFEEDEDIISAGIPPRDMEEFAARTGLRLDNEGEEG